MTPAAGKARLAPPADPSGRPPPSDIDTEAGVLQTVMDHGSPALEDVMGILGEEHWFSEPHRLIWQALVALHGAGREIRATTVGQWLRDKGLMQAVGGVGYFLTLETQATSLSLLVRNAERIVRKARLRDAIARAREIVAEGYGDLDDEAAEVWLEQVPERLREDEAGGPVDAVHIGQAMRRVWEERAEHARQGSVSLGPPTGIKDLDERMGGLRPGKVTTVAARSGVGKTALALQAGTNVAIHGDGVLIFELEAPEDECVDRVQYATAGVDGSCLLANRRLPDEDMRAMTAAAETICRSPFYIITKSDITVTEMRAAARRLARHLERMGKRLALVIVDYVQLVSARDMPGRSQNREAEVSYVSRNLKRLSMDLKTHVMVLAQLNKDGDRRGEDRRPRTSDMRESSAIEMDSDCIILIHNPEGLARSRGERDGEASDDVELILGKNRGGKPGTVYAKWVPAQQSFCCAEKPKWAA